MGLMPRVRPLPLPILPMPVLGPLAIFGCEGVSGWSYRLSRSRGLRGLLLGAGLGGAEACTGAGCSRSSPKISIVFGGLGGAAGRIGADGTAGAADRTESVLDQGSNCAAGATGGAGGAGYPGVIGVIGAEYSGVSGTKDSSSSYDSNSNEAADCSGGSTAAGAVATGTAEEVSKKLSPAKVLLLLLSVGLLTNSGSKRFSAAGCALALALAGVVKSASSNGLKAPAAGREVSSVANPSKSSKVNELH